MRKHSKIDLWNSLSLDLVGVQVEGRFAFVNTAGIRMLGGTCPEQVVGRSVLEFVHPDYRGLVAERIRVMTAERRDTAPVAEKWVRLDGAVIDVQVSEMYITYNDKPAVHMIAKDISGQR